MNLLVWHEFRRGCRRAILASVFGMDLEVVGPPQLLFTDASKPLAGCAVIRTCNATCGAWRHRDAHQYRENKLCLRQKKSSARKMSTEANIIKRPDARRSAASATSTCGSNPSRAQYLTYCACSGISDAPSSRPVACQRSTRPKPLTAPPRHPQLSSRPPLCGHLSLSFAKKQAKAVTAPKDGAGPPLPKAFMERVPEVPPRRFHSLPADLKARGRTKASSCCS